MRSLNHISLLFVIVVACGTGGDSAEQTTTLDRSTSTSSEAHLSSTTSIESRDMNSDIVGRALDLAATETSADVEDIEILSARSVTFSDGSLDCPEPGRFYTQALVDGFWVVVQTPSGRLDLRAGPDGVFRVCSDGSEPYSTQADS